MSKTREFRVGDRVVADYKGGVAHGRTGTVVCLSGYDIGVELDGKFDGHSVGGRIKSNRGWWIHKDNLKFIPKFKVGDKVRVLDGKNIPNYTGSWNMNGEIGKVHTIREVMEHYSDDRVGYIMEGTWYTFDERGLELVEEKDVKPTTKYKVGDRVRVRKDLTTHKSYKMMNCSDGYVAVSSMLEFRDKDVTITNVGSDYYYIAENHLKWTDEMFEGLTSECEKLNKNKIVIYCEGRDVIAKNTETGETAKATCHPDDKFDFNIGAKLAFERLMNPIKIVKQAKYEIGDKVKIIDKWVHGCYQNSEGKMDKYLGTVMTIRKVVGNDYKMIEDKDEHGGDGWYWTNKCIEGKVVTVEKAEIKEVIEVKRHAKVGEYVKIVKASVSFGDYENGDILKVEEVSDGFLNEYVNLRTKIGGVYVNPSEYVVLEGYEPTDETPKKVEPKKEEPKLYNGKVVCVGVNETNKHLYTKGKIYEFKNGKLTTDTGRKLPSITDVRSFREWEKFTMADFIEVVE